MIYGNLRPENILVKINPNAEMLNDVIENLELIDFSQACEFSKLG